MNTKNILVACEESQRVFSSAKDRSKTFPGVARAMFEQWFGILDSYPIQLQLF